jgi:hypothetical protein
MRPLRSCLRRAAGVEPRDRLVVATHRRRLSSSSSLVTSAAALRQLQRRQCARHASTDSAIIGAPVELNVGTVLELESLFDEVAVSAFAQVHTLQTLPP